MALAAALSLWDEPSTSAAAAERYDRLAEATDLTRAYLFPKDIGSGRSYKTSATDEILAAVRLLQEEGRVGGVFQDFLDAVESRFFLVKRDIHRFMNRLQEATAVALVPQTDPIMVEMLDRLALWQRVWGTPLKVFNDPKLIPMYTSLFHHNLHTSLPASFPPLLASLLRSSLSSSSTSPPSPHLNRLGILPRYSPTLSRVAYEEIERIAREEAGEGWDQRRLGRARQRVGEGVAGWLSGMFEGNEAAQVALRPMFSRFDYYLCKVFFDIRTDELFDIIVDYPDSMAALEDLKECLYKVDQRNVLVEKLVAANLKRLLHPGAETPLLLTQYISTIRSLRILDPPGVLLHKVAGPIRKHLRERPDTVRCIVERMVEGEDAEDGGGGGVGGASMLRDGGGDGEGDVDEAEDWSDAKWEPEPVDAAPEFRSGKAGDILQTLVSIYETKEVIVKELQALLAERLLLVKDYDAVKEIRTIELLKLRFGETALQVCDVMLKDMADSKRIDDHVHGDIKSDVHPLVISRMFWPGVPGSALHLTPKLEAAQTSYASAFHTFKPDKHLRFLQSLGSVTISLELADRTLEVECTPLQASVAELFGERDEWHMLGLLERLGMGERGGRGEKELRAVMGWWVDRGLLERVEEEGEAGQKRGEEEGERWRVVERLEEGSQV